MDCFYKVQVKMFSYACLLFYQVGAVYFEFSVLERKHVSEIT